MKRKLIVGGAVAGSVIVAGGVAYAVLGGTVNIPEVATGLAVGSGGNACQTQGVTFTLPDPTWSVPAANYVINGVDFSNINSTCVNLGTAKISLTMTNPNNGSIIAQGTASGIGASGTITLNSVVPFSVAEDARYNYLVSNS